MARVRSQYEATRAEQVSEKVSEKVSAQSPATCTDLNEHLLSSSSQEAPKFALKFFRKYSY